MEQLLADIQAARIYDLAQPYYPGMPHHPNHPPFLFGLNKKHGDYVARNGASSASEGIALGGHVGTHIDALVPFFVRRQAARWRRSGGPAKLPRRPGAPYGGYHRAHPAPRQYCWISRGKRVWSALPADFEITPEHLDAAVAAAQMEVRPGDVVLLRTGWARFWDDAARFIAQVHGPGPGEAGARWLSSRGVFAAGSDTVAFEKVPDSNMPVHVHLLVESGIHIIECLNLEQLAAERQYTFLFVATPLKIRGGTGSPIRPLAIA